ncbi:hypothetical protein B0T11DRAFT_300182 [Plectosphaerella cucumerina]|uniref:Uncharacterized protein n=1 Tax=Plectosphaerella cucumerina TaxID=40658 RepID=A0A8K0X2G8_9PEZI|nr:hypothetical protein B0T11DRAFT_300182 [Plectosphaerella cucumerina]
MRYPRVILGFAASVALSAAVPSPSVAPLPGAAPLPIGQLGWEGVVIDGEPPVEVWGASFEDIEAKIRAQYNPDFSIYTKEENKPPAVSENNALVARTQLEARQRNINCDQRYGDAQSLYVDEGINHLRRVNGNSCKARARTCILNMCVWTSGIGMCNDNTWDIDIPCTTIADYAQVIGMNCAWMPHPECHGPDCTVAPWNLFEKGQAFSPHLSWNVIVGSCSFWGATGERPVKA